MNRRELLTGAVAMVAAASAGRALAAEHNHADAGATNTSPEHKHHKSARNQKLIDAASDCALKANICLQHCLVLMGEGDKSLAACARSASQVAAVAAALQLMASAEAQRLPQLAKVVMDICKDCEDECKKTDKHPECKACGEACAVCYKECKAIAV